MFHGKPIIGITGGIGSGKSTVARIFGEAGCLVIDSDQLGRQVYQDPAVVRELRGWWGDDLVGPNGELNRRKIADIVFADPGQMKRLEGLLHPRVDELRKEQMAAAVDDPQIQAYIWDTPLLLEAGLRADCDAVVFVESAFRQRLERVMQTRRWDEAELVRREKMQWPLDKKRKISDYIIDNTADAAYVRSQVREVLSRILAK